MILFKLIVIIKNFYKILINKSNFRLKMIACNSIISLRNAKLRFRRLIKNLVNIIIRKFLTKAVCSNHQ
jgi:hypothetical protein